jgi:hypothetical protein
VTRAPSKPKQAIAAEISQKARVLMLWLKARGGPQERNLTRVVPNSGDLNLVAGKVC